MSKRVLIFDLDGAQLDTLDDIADKGQSLSVLRFNYALEGISHWVAAVAGKGNVLLPAIDHKIL